MDKFLKKIGVVTIMVIVLAGSAVLTAWVKADLYTVNAQTLSQTATVDAVSGVAVTTSFSDYYIFEPVVITLKNNGTSPVTLSNTASWAITDSSGVTVYVPISLQVLDTVLPGQTREWRWDQKNNSGNQVKPGSYWLVFRELGLSAPVNIRNELGSSGYFIFKEIAPNTDTVRVYLTKPQAVRSAIDRYYRRNLETSPVGPVIDDRPNTSPYDYRWHWHLDPNNTDMAFICPEAYNSTLKGIEGDIDYWAYHLGSACPIVDVVGLDLPAGIDPTDPGTKLFLFKLFLYWLIYRN